jgi:hypothetical protein
LVQGGTEFRVDDPHPVGIDIILEDPDLDQDRHTGPTDPDLDPYLFQPYLRQNYRYFFPETFRILSKIVKIMTAKTLTRKIKQFKPAHL